jgi:SAM-dependent methyltransferase
MTAKPLVYGNWIRRRILWRLGASALVVVVLAALPIHPVIRVAAGTLFVILFVSLLFPLYAYYAFSPKGGNLQERIFDWIVEILGQREGEDILDIGTGNGVLAVKLAMHNRGSRVTAIDYWGKNWEYAKAQCEENAQIAQVSDSIRFIRGDAAALEFSDSAFDAVVSNLTFHEVETAPHKRDAVAEALRVLKVGGGFVFVDYFFQAKIYGPAADFDEFIEDLGIRHHELKPIGDAVPLSWMLRHPRVLGKVGVLSGQK